MRCASDLAPGGVSQGTGRRRHSVPISSACIIVATTTPDMIFPAPPAFLQAKLGASGFPAFDVQAVCSGFVYALATADLFIRSGQCRYALVVGTRDLLPHPRLERPRAPACCLETGLRRLCWRPANSPAS